jgi:hypothetical protein
MCTYLKLVTLLTRCLVLIYRLWDFAPKLRVAKRHSIRRSRVPVPVSPGLARRELQSPRAPRCGLPLRVKSVTLSHRVVSLCSDAAVYSSADGIVFHLVRLTWTASSSNLSRTHSVNTVIVPHVAGVVGVHHANAAMSARPYYKQLSCWLALLAEYR